jgi:hypothetical protein
VTDVQTEDEAPVLLAEIRALGQASPAPAPGAPTGSLIGSPLESPPVAAEIHLWRDTICDTIQQALVIWATEVCPRFPAADCIQLAAIDFDVDAGGAVVAGSVVVVDSDRPVLVPTRLSQELFCLLDREGGVGDHGLLAGLGDDDHPHYLTQAEGDTLYAPLGHSHAVVPGITVHGALTGLDADDHPQYFDQTRGDARYALLNHSHALDNLSDVNAPSPGRDAVLTWNADVNEWQSGSAIGERDLTRIVALSWAHNRPNALNLIHDGNETYGLAIAFGKQRANDGGMALAVTLNANTFQVFTETADAGGFLIQRRLPPRAIVPVDVQLSGNQIIRTATNAADRAPGALFIFDSTMLANLTSLQIVVRGDFILDETGERAIDAEFTRGQLPTGDRPAGGDRGIQGGRFESWLGLRGDFPDRITINIASRDEIRRLPGMTDAMADAIVVARDATPFNTIDDLAAVPGITPDMVDGLSGLIVAR